MPPAFVRPPGQPSEVADATQARELAAWILDPARERPLLVLTVRNDEQQPYFPTNGMQRLVGLAGDVVWVRNTRKSRLTRELARNLPEGLMVFAGAARIYWPIGLAGTEPEHHPLVRADDDPGRAAEKRARLANRWRQGPRNTDGPPAAPVQRHVAPPTAWSGEDDLRVDITRAWAQLLPSAGQRTAFGLRAFDVHRDLVEQLQVLEPARTPVATAAAEIVSGHVWTLRAPVPKRVEVDGTPILRTGDHAVAWRYELPGGDQHLHYWQPTNGPVILLRIASGTHAELPDAITHAAAPRSAADDTPPTESASRPPAFTLDDDELVAALRAGDAPMYVSEIRDALSIPEDISRERVSRALNAAIERGLIVRTGQRRATRYAAP